MLSPSLLITSPARASWGFCLIRDAWGLCLHCADERSAVKRQNRVETKGFFLLRSHIGAISKTAVPLPGVPNSLTWSLPLYPIHPACCWFMKISKGKRKGPPKWYRKEETCLTKPLLLFTLSWAVQMPPPVQITGILEQRSYPTTTEDALLSQVLATDQGRWLFSAHRFNPWWAGPCVMKGCKLK